MIYACPFQVNYSSLIGHARCTISDRTWSHRVHFRRLWSVLSISLLRSSINWCLLFFTYYNYYQIVGSNGNCWKFIFQSNMKSMKYAKDKPIQYRFHSCCWSSVGCRMRNRYWIGLFFAYFIDFITWSVQFTITIFNGKEKSTCTSSYHDQAHVHCEETYDKCG